MMHEKLLSAGLLFAIAGAATTLWSGPGLHGPERKGPYKAVVSKPLVSPGHRVGTLYTEHEELTEMMNQLDKEGLRPVLSELLRAGSGRGAEEVRMLVLCVAK
jgi:hypothetical protein